MHPLIFIFSSFLLLLSPISAINFPYESIQLTDSDISIFPDLKFGDSSLKISTQDTPECKSFPGDPSWPADSDWSRLNSVLNGSLLHPLPLGAPCYQGPSYNLSKCQAVNSITGYTAAAREDPLAVITLWAEGGTCLPSLNATGACEQGGYPVYVINVTTVKDIQAGINFARNRNLRLVIKNAGHDFGGRSVGAGSLSIWTYHLKSFEFLPEFSIGEYKGMAVKVGAGIEAWELFNYMSIYNITVVAPGGSSVGVGGGWMAGGGHGWLTSKYGLGSDQVLSIQVVTARWEIGTFGIVTSFIMKAYPPITITQNSLNFIGAVASGNKSTTAPSERFTIYDGETFFKGVSLYYRFAKKIVDAGGIGFSYVTPLGNNRYSFTTTNSLPGLTQAQVVDLMQPLYDDLKVAGLNIANPKSLSTSPYGHQGSDGGTSQYNVRYRSRLIPRKNWEDDNLWNQTFGAIRKSIEAGFTFHGTLNGPSKKIAGWPGSSSGVNPAWRPSVMHSMLIETQAMGLTAQQADDEEAKIQDSMDLWRELTPGAGSYINEGDPGEQNWQWSFFGDLYPQLLQTKRRRDPWGLFWAITTVGSEGWEVKTEDGYPSSQNGRLCRVGYGG
ncbi:hypothetical protein G7Y89_g6508 [Cudoniella acicularis]|uniref:FAD-binding PCMH-type domain-containing protein n=1 Tax=Cudoniella acicularis TaxID=354080 RepID=A0A8H4W4P5_9HELO|nr:hypothetical protein G7Y89_g6508 [Cudoniella acicularis]